MGNPSTELPSPHLSQQNEVQKTQKTEAIKAANISAETKLTKVSNITKTSWAMSPLGMTGGGDEKLNMVSMGPTLTSPDGETRITAGYTSTSERPDPNMNTRNTDGLGISVNTTPGSIGRGFRKIGKSIKNVFKKKK